MRVTFGSVVPGGTTSRWNRRWFRVCNRVYVIEEERERSTYNYVERIEVERGRRGLWVLSPSRRIKEDDTRAICWLRPVQRCVTVLTGERVRVYALDEGVPGEFA